MYQKLHVLRASRAVIRYLWWLVILFWVFGSRRSNRVFRMIEPLENFGQNSTGTIDTKCHKTVRRNLSSKIQCFIQQTQILQAFKSLYELFLRFSFNVNFKTLKRVIAHWQFDSKICDFELTTKDYQIILVNWLFRQYLFKTFCSVGYWLICSLRLPANF